jgi:uncharacterized protein (TIGR03437 family)
MRPRHLAGFLAAVLGGVTPAGAAVNLSYLDVGPGGSACCLVPDGRGNLYAVGSFADLSGTGISITRLDATNHVAGSFTFGGGEANLARAAALDPQGNLVIGGQTGSSDFPLVNALISKTEPGATAGFITKVNPTSGQILFSTRIGGVAVESFVRTGTVVNAVAVDPAGNIYAAGWTNAADFPVSANAFQKSGAGGDSFGPRPYGFVLKLSPGGDRLLYSTLLGGATANCLGGSHCLGKSGSNTVNSIAVDRNGIVTAVGATNAPDFPVTAGVVQTVCRCQEYANNGFAAQLNADGSGLRWATFLGGSWYGFSQLPAGTNTIDAVGQDAAGNVVVAGRTDADDFPTTHGVLQTKLAGPTEPYQRFTDGFVAKLNPTGTALIFSTYLGGSAEDRVNDLQIDAQGNIWVTGATGSTDFPGNPASFTGSFFALVSADGARLTASQRTPADAAGQAIRTGDAVTVLGVSGSVLQVPGGQAQGVAVFGIASTAGNRVKAYVAPGEFISLYGSLLGPSPGIAGILDNQGRIANQLAGVQVLFNGIPSPLLYASQGQVNALVPYEIAGNASASVQVTTGGGNSPAVSLYLRPAQPEVLNSGGAALALNQDSTVNSPLNPAAPGSIVTIFASGAGRSSSSLPEGSIPSQPAGGPVLPVAVMLNNRSLEVLYAGNAPGLVVNLLQVNVRLPQQGAGGEYRLAVGGFFSDPFTLAVQQGGPKAALGQAWHSMASRLPTPSVPGSGQLVPSPGRSNPSVRIQPSLITKMPGNRFSHPALATGTYSRALASTALVPGTWAAIPTEWTSAAPGHVRSCTQRNIWYFCAAAAINSEPD